jgi:hypothetical protein
VKGVVIDGALWSIALIGVAVAAAGVRAVSKSSLVVPQPLPAAWAEPRRFAADSIDGSVAYTVANDPFRLSRQPASVAYAPAREGMVPPPIIRAPRPNLVLRGIVGGPPWRAIIEGIPGHDGGTLLRQGDTVAALLVRAIGRDTVIIKGADTTWRLTVTRSR